MSTKKLKIALLVGGTSPEREVSKMSGKGILKALKKLGYPVLIVDPAYGLNQPKDEESYFSNINHSKISNRNCIEAVNSDLFNDIDVVFSAMHGKWAEDGTIQSLLELTLHCSYFRILSIHDMKALSGTFIYIPPTFLSH